MKLSTSPNRLAWIYLVLSLPVLIITSFTLGPFQSADEVVHFFRAYQISRGHLIGSSRPGSSQLDPGGDIDQAALETAAMFQHINFHPEVKISPELMQRARITGWSGARTFVGFPTAVIYPPFFYAPAAVAIKAGRAMGVSVLDTLTLSRLAQGITSISLAFFAIRSARQGAFTLAAILWLPMSLALFGACTQDGPMIGALALVVALLTRPLKMRDKIFIALTIGGITAARFALFPLFLIFLTTPFQFDRGKPLWVRLSQGFPWATLASILVIGWYSLGYAPFKIPFRVEDGVSPSAQIAHLVEHPSFILKLAITTLQERWVGYAEQFVGVLGWLDVKFSTFTYAVYGCSLVFALLQDNTEAHSQLTPADRLLFLIAIIASAAAIFLAIYLGWTPVGEKIVTGVQGRYFIAPMLLLALAATGMKRMAASFRCPLQIVLFGCCIFAPLHGLFVVPRTLMVRYWG